MSKASKVSHFHSTTYSAHRGGVAHATLGRPMAPSAPPTRPGVVGAISDSTSLTSKDRWVASCVGESVNYGYAKYTSKCNKPGSVGSMSLFSWDDGQIRAIFIYNGMDSQQIRNMFLPFGGDSFYNGPDLSKKFRIIEGTPWSGWKMIGVPVSVAMAFAKNYGIPTNFKQENVDTNTQIVTGTSPCPPNQHRNASNTACECDQGYTKNAAGSCVAMDYYGKDITPPVKAACPRGWVRNAQGKCVKLPSTAPQTQHRKNVFQQPFDRPGKIHGDLIDGTVGAMKSNAPSIGNRVVTLGCPPGTHDDGTGFFGENCVPDAQSNGPQLQEVKETIDWIATCNKQGGIYDPDSKYYDPKDPCFQCAKGMTYDWDLHDCVGTPVTPPPPQPATPQGCEPGYSLIQNPKSGESFCTQCVQEHNVLNWTTGDCTCESGFIWQDKKDPNNFKCVPKPVVEPPHPPAPKTNCGPGTHAEGEMCVANETKQVEPAAKEEDNTWKWVAGIAAAAVVVGGGTYLAMKKDKKGQKSALQAKLSSHSTQTDVS